MKIGYQNSIDDLVAFSLHHFDKSPSARRMVAYSRWVLGLLVLVAGGWLSVTIGSVPAAVSTALVMIGYMVFIPRFQRRSVEKRARQIWEEGSTKGAVGPHELEITDDGLFERTEVGERRVSWEGIARADSTDEYVFIFLNAVTGLVVPRRAVTVGDHEAFANALRERLHQERGRSGGEHQRVRPGRRMGREQPAANREPPSSPPVASPGPPARPVARQEKHSGVGVASFVMALVLGTAYVALFGLWGVLDVRAPGGTQEESPVATVLVGAMTSAVFFNVVGLALGITGLFDRDRNRVFAILGVCFNSFIVLGLVALACVGYCLVG